MTHAADDYAVTRIYTDAPACYDQGRTRTVCPCGETTEGINKGSQVRIVEAHQSEAGDQRSRYASGLYLYADEEGYLRLLEAGVVQAVEGAGPNTIHGFVILAKRDLGIEPGSGLNPARLILVDRGDDVPERFVVARHNYGDKTWYWGHYFHSLEEAVADMKQRACGDTAERVNGIVGENGTSDPSRDKLLDLHTREQGEHTVTYPPKPGREAEAANEWPRTGVCPSCHRRAVSASRCLQCGYDALSGRVQA